MLRATTYPQSDTYNYIVSTLTNITWASWQTTGKVADFLKQSRAQIETELERIRYLSSPRNGVLIHQITDVVLASDS